MGYINFGSVSKRIGIIGDESTILFGGKALALILGIVAVSLGSCTSACAFARFFTSR